MKLNRNFVQISATAIVTSTILIGSMMLFREDRFTLALHNKSERIKWVDADILRTEYKEFKPLFVKTTDGVIDTLEGFVFSAEHLREIVDLNHDPKGNPDEVIFYFGKDGTFRHGSGLFDPIRPNMHIIAVGMKGGQLLTNDTTTLGPSIFDKAEPCPPKCPK